MPQWHYNLKSRSSVETSLLIKKLVFVGVEVWIPTSILMHKAPHFWERPLAMDSTCHSCQKISHWKQKCRKSNKAKDAHKTPRSQPENQQGGRKRADEVGVSEGDPSFDELMIHAWQADQKRLEDLKQITPTNIYIDTMTEAFATVDMLVASESQPLMQGGYWCRRKCDVRSSLWKTLPQSVNKNWLWIMKMHYQA